VPARVFVLAGVNGAGKSSIGGAALRSRGAEVYDPDAAARLLVDAYPGLSLEQANALAWEQGRRGLERALRDAATFAFETTLGGTTIANMLIAGAQAGADVHVWYTGLASADLHIQRVRARVRAGGHDIPDEVIHARFDGSRANLVRVLPHLVSLRAYDNSAEADPRAGHAPRPILLLHWERGRFVSHVVLEQVPQWAKPIIAAAFAAARDRPELR
jgi:predicted ABC-type ATPase